MVDKVRILPETKIHDAETSTGFGSNVDVTGIQYLTIEVFVPSGGTATIKVAKSNQVAEPTFGGTLSATNKWGYLGCYNEDTGVFTAGSTGESLSAGVTHLHVNTAAANWINANLAANSGGAVTATIIGMGTE